MEAAIDRIMMTYDLLVNRSAAASAEARAKVTEYVNTLFEAGEKTASADGVRPDLFAPARRQQRSGQGGIYGAVSGRMRLRAPHNSADVHLAGCHFMARSYFWTPRTSTGNPRKPHAHAPSSQ